MQDSFNNDLEKHSEIHSNWFESWFDTPYYHILYKDRDDTEAQFFMDTITQYLNLPEDSTILDLACGKGRHAIYLNEIGYDVVGYDLSEKSIAEASEFENDKLHFKVHDMRKPFDKKFDAIFNLFTSFGYFECDSDNLKTLESIRDGLTEYGFGVIDFMNADYVIENLVAEEIKIVDGITFEIKRWYDGEFIQKAIDFEDKGEKFHFTERVQALTLQKFETMMQELDIDLIDIFGDYKLHKFSKKESERLIMIFK
ncbi:SAM-dependent methyltransferase [Flavobacterium ardleyense]|uniref:SAM-dependent methyltransferase n=1 Tax=Flavobacterium ardleyense TaxID=2038737 RepID=UPI00298C57B8|nr:methyltransferase domain-containing protein [Flavobacterium ardleyense]